MFCCACVSNPAHVVFSALPLFGVRTENTVLAVLKVSPVSVLFILLRILVVKFTLPYQFREKSSVVLRNLCGCGTEKCLE